MKVKALLFILVIIAVLISSLYASRASYNQTREAKGNQSPDGSLFANRAGDLFTADIKAVHLEEVLKELSRDYGIKFLLPSSLADEEMMVRFSNLKLDKGIKKILSSYNTIFMYREGGWKHLQSPLTNLQEVRIYPSKNKRAKEEVFITISDSNLQAVGETGKQNEELIVIKLKKKPQKMGKKPTADLSGGVRKDDARERVETGEERSTIKDKRNSGRLARKVLKDKDPEVRKPEEDVLKGIGDPRELTENEVGDERDDAKDSGEGNDGNGGNAEDEEEEDDDDDGDKNRPGRVDPACSSAIEDGNTIVVPIMVRGDKGMTIQAWGFDVNLKGMEYVGSIKSGCLAEESSSFMCNKLANGNVRCGSYTGELDIEGVNTLFDLELKKTNSTGNTTVSLFNFVDNLAGASSAGCKIE